MVHIFCTLPNLNKHTLNQVYLKFCDQGVTYYTGIELATFFFFYEATVMRNALSGKLLLLVARKVLFFSKFSLQLCWTFYGAAPKVCRLKTLGASESKGDEKSGAERHREECR